MPSRRSHRSPWLRLSRRRKPQLTSSSPVIGSISFTSGRDGKFAYMRRNLAIALSALILMSVAALAEEDIAGTYVGDYVNKAGKSGGYQLTFTPGPGGNWTGEVIAVWTGSQRSPS